MFPLFCILFLLINLWRKKWTYVLRILKNLLSNKCYDWFLGFIKFWSSQRKTENTVSHLYFDEKSYYSEKNTCDNAYCFG